MPFVSATDHEVIHTMSVIYVHDMPQNWPVTDFDHGLGSNTGFLGDSGAKAPGENYCFHAVIAQSSQSNPENALSPPDNRIAIANGDSSYSIEGQRSYWPSTRNLCTAAHKLYVTSISYRSGGKPVLQRVHLLLRDTDTVFPRSAGPDTGVHYVIFTHRWHALSPGGTWNHARPCKTGSGWTK
jgi:hypothetical protein